MLLRGNGTVHDPIRSVDGSCAFRLCVEIGGFLRLTRSGNAVKYCHFHSTEGARLFDKRPERNGN